MDKVTRRLPGETGWAGYELQADERFREMRKGCVHNARPHGHVERSCVIGGTGYTLPICWFAPRRHMTVVNLRTGQAIRRG